MFSGQRYCSLFLRVSGVRIEANRRRLAVNRWSTGLASSCQQPIADQCSVGVQAGGRTLWTALLMICHTTCERQGWHTGSRGQGVRSGSSNRCPIIAHYHTLLVPPQCYASHASADKATARKGVFPAPSTHCLVCWYLRSTTFSPKPSCTGMGLGQQPAMIHRSDFAKCPPFCACTGRVLWLQFEAVHSGTMPKPLQHAGTRCVPRVQRAPKRRLVSTWGGGGLWVVNFV